VFKKALGSIFAPHQGVLDFPFMYKEETKNLLLENPKSEIDRKHEKSSSGCLPSLFK
jgi:hypothetical protein